MAVLPNANMGARQDLDRWRNGRSYRRAAEALGINPTVLFLLISGERRPGRETANRIEAQTGIRSTAWDEEPPRKRRKKAA